MSVTFPAGVNRVEFVADFGFVLDTLEIANIRRVKTDVGYGYIDITSGENAFGFKEGDNVKIKIIPLSGNCVSEAVFYGRTPKSEC